MLSLFGLCEGKRSAHPKNELRGFAPVFGVPASLRFNPCETVDPMIKFTQCLRAVGSMVEHYLHTVGVGGSNPSPPIKFIWQATKKI